MKWHSSTTGKGNQFVSTWLGQTPSGFGFPCLLHICEGVSTSGSCVSRAFKECGWTYTLSSKSQSVISILCLPFQDYTAARASQASRYAVAAGWASFITPDLSPSAIQTAVTRTAPMRLIALGGLSSRHARGDARWPMSSRDRRSGTQQKLRRVSQR